MEIIVKEYNSRYNGIEVVNYDRIEANEDYIENLYKHRKIKKPYNKNIGSNVLIFYAKKKYTSEILDRLREHNRYFRAEKKL